MKRGAKNLAKDFIVVFDQLEKIYPTKSRSEILKLLALRFKGSPHNILELDRFLQDKSFWDGNPSLESVILNLVCLRLYNTGADGSFARRGFNAVAESVDEILNGKEK